MKKYPDSELQDLQENQYLLPQADFDLLIKPVPFATERNVMDPRFYQQQKNLSFLMGLSAKIDQGLAIRTTPIIKKMFDLNKTSKVIKGKLIKEDLTVDTVSHQIPLRIYRKNDQPTPVLIYIHGGGFFGGTLESADELCRSLVLSSELKVVSISYRLAPAFKFPQALHDCLDTLDYVYDNCERLGIDPTQIYLAGDSAGGNLVLATILKEQELGKKRVKKAILIYPVVDMRSFDDTEYKWNIERYETIPYQKQTVHDSVIMGKIVGPLLSEIYLSRYTSPANPLVSPILADLRLLPPLLIIYGQYDFLRLQIEEFIRRLNEESLPVKAIQYLGLGHGFIEWLDTYPQTMDSLQEICAFLENNA